jgi:hypothetical protein
VVVGSELFQAFLLFDDGFYFDGSSVISVNRITSSPSIRHRRLLAVVGQIVTFKFQNSK